jgi:hypothetical protein
MEMISRIGRKIIKVFGAKTKFQLVVKKKRMTRASMLSILFDVLAWSMF